MSHSIHNQEVPRTRQHFVTTQWSLILAARGEDSDSAAALNQLCQVYWPALFVFARRDGLSAPDAEDAVQSFIAKLLERRDLNEVSPAAGRFRSYLCAAFKNFLISRARGEQAVRRGGGEAAIHLDIEALEAVCAPELAHEATPDRAFDRTWARRLMTRALQRLSAEHQSPRQAQVFAALQGTLMEGGRVRQEAQLAAQLGLTPGALAVAATRLRQRYRALIEAEIRQTLVDPADLAEEMRTLWQAWS